MPVIGLTKEIAMQMIGSALVLAFTGIQAIANQACYGYYEAYVKSDLSPYYAPWLHDHVELLILKIEFALVLLLLLPGITLVFCGWWRNGQTDRPNHPSGS